MIITNVTGVTALDKYQFDREGNSFDCMENKVMKEQKRAIPAAPRAADEPIRAIIALISKYNEFKQIISQLDS